MSSGATSIACSSALVASSTLPFDSATTAGELLQLRVVGLLGDRLLDPRERLVGLAHLLFDLEQTAQDVGLFGRFSSALSRSSRALSFSPFAV
jgi:hypothetical protein